MEAAEVTNPVCVLGLLQELEFAGIVIFHLPVTCLWLSFPVGCRQHGDRSSLKDKNDVSRKVCLSQDLNLTQSDQVCYVMGYHNDGVVMVTTTMSGATHVGTGSGSLLGIHGGQDRNMN